MLLVIVLVILLIFFIFFGARGLKDTFRTFGAGLNIDDTTDYTLSQYSEDTYIYPLDAFPDKPGCYSNGYRDDVQLPCVPEKEQKKLCIKAGHCFQPMPGSSPCYRRNVLAGL